MSSARALPRDLLDRKVAQAKQIGGRLCLDFVNAVGGWTPGPDASGTPVFIAREDRLLSYEDLVAWAFRAEALTEDQVRGLLRESSLHPQIAVTVFKRGVRLRGAIHSIARAFESGRSAEAHDLEVLAQEAATARETQRLQQGAANLEWRLPEHSSPLDAPLALVSLSAEDYFTRADLSRLHFCPGPECGWLFEDTTRNRSRRWCVMGDCGNSAKVQKFRAQAKKTAKALKARPR